MTVVEIGSWIGDSAVAMAKAGAFVICVDHFKGNHDDHLGHYVKQHGSDAIYNKFMENTACVRDKIRLIRKSSFDAAKDFNYGKVDMIFIDAGHSYEVVKSDILAWLPYLNDDGFMVLHDANVEQCPGVDKAVYEIFGDKAETYGHTKNGAFWLVRNAKEASGLFQACFEK
jgi:predicted O-methyltransferase YrrM